VSSPFTTLDAAIAHHVDKRGFRLDMIMPADAPRIAIVSKNGEALRLTATASGVQIEPATALPPLVIPEGEQQFLITRAAGSDTWGDGRAGMQYRDLIPGRLGGRYIASHIRITGGGPVDDYVHHHRIRFQMIYCRRGWVRVVYQDQGSPFVMHEGDCVLQPPGIRHRVLESSAGLEVIEVGSPAEHETFRDHDLALPTQTLNPERTFDGQRFVHHIAATAAWQHAQDLDVRDTGIASATDGLASVRVLRATRPIGRKHEDDFLFFVVLNGRPQITCGAHGTHTLEADDACVIPKGADYKLAATEPFEVLEVAVRSD
jgi:mannose-6-phosphate isomerase-like protein (cupin superfamily)